MPSDHARTLSDAVRDRVGLRSALSTAVALGVLWLLVGSPVHLATSVAGLVVVGALDVLSEVYSLRESVKHGVFGAYTGLAGAGLLAAGGAGWLPVGFVLVGGWFVLDAVQTVRHDGATEESPDGRDVYLDYVARRVHELLGERPRTRRELDDALAAESAVVDAALARLRERGVVERAGSEYRVTPDASRGRLSRTRQSFLGLLRRVARPVTVEFGREASGDGAWPLRARTRVGSGDETAGAAVTGSDDTADDVPGETTQVTEER